MPYQDAMNVILPQQGTIKIRDADGNTAQQGQTLADHQQQQQAQQQQAARAMQGAGP